MKHISEYMIDAFMLAISQSEFDHIEVKHEGDSVNVSLSGQPFGIIGALAVLLNNLKEQSDIPIKELLNLVSIATYKVEEQRGKRSCSISDLLELFGKAMEEDN